MDWLERGDFDRRELKVGGHVPGRTGRRVGSQDAPAMFAVVVEALRNVADPPDTSPAPRVVGGSMAAFLGVDG